MFPDHKPIKYKNQDSWQWTILFFAAVNVIFLGGKRRAFGIFVAEFHHGEFKNVTLAELNWIGDSYAALGYLTTSLSTALILYCNKRFRLFQFIGACFVLVACLTSAAVYSAHLLFITHTLLHGIGSSLILSTVGLVVNEHFDKKHRYHILATTLVSGGSVASIVFVQFYASIIESYGWRMAFVILGVIYFVVNCTGVVVFTRHPDVPLTHKHRKCSLNWGDHITRFHTPLLVMWTIDRMMTSIVTYGMLLNLTDFSRRSEKTLSGSTTLTILFAAGEASTYVIGAVVTGLTKNWFKNRLKYVLLICTGFMACCLVFWELVVGIHSLSCILAFLSGFFLGPSITFLFPAGEEMTLLPGHLAYPFSLGGMGLGMLLSPTLSAMVASAFQYKGFFLVQGCLITVKFICLLFLCVLSKKLVHLLPKELASQAKEERMSSSDSKKSGSGSLSDTDDSIDIKIR